MERLGKQGCSLGCWLDWLLQQTDPSKSFCLPGSHRCSRQPNHQKSRAFGAWHRNFVQLPQPTLLSRPLAHSPIPPPPTRPRCALAAAALRRALPRHPQCCARPGWSADPDPAPHTLAVMIPAVPLPRAPFLDPRTAGASAGHAGHGPSTQCHCRATRNFPNSYASPSTSEAFTHPLAPPSRPRPLPETPPRPTRSLGPIAGRTGHVLRPPELRPLSRTNASCCRRPCGSKPSCQA